MGYAVRTILTSVMIVTGSLSALAEVRCPASLESFAYARASVFDGPPEEQADLVPDSQKGGTDTWRVGGIFNSGRVPYLVCRYQGTARTVSFQLQRPATVCLAPQRRGTAFCR
nr:STY0301 family protein [uncultured Rhodopila sp.]